jgi:hypothetical protein
MYLALLEFTLNYQSQSFFKFTDDIINFISKKIYVNIFINNEITKFSFLGVYFNLLDLEQKSAYPYITKFKKQPFKSFVTIKKRNVGNYYLKEYSKLAIFYNYFINNLLSTPNLTLVDIFWFSLLKKYTKNENKDNRDDLFKYIKKCEINQFEQLGFKLSHNQEKPADIYSTYLALSSLKSIGLLKEYFSSEGKSQIKEEIKNFVLSLRSGDKFLHCHDKHCDICKEMSPARILFYVMEIFTLLGIDIRNSKEQFRLYIGESKKKPEALLYKFLCLKYLDLDSEVKDKEVQNILQFQKASGGFGFTQLENLNDTFWIVYTLNNFSWLLDYNSSGVYFYINNKLRDILRDEENWNIVKLAETSQLIILLSLIWKRFIDEIERTLFKELEKENYVDLYQLKTTFGLSDDIEDLISYINLNYNFNLRTLDNKIEYKNYVRSLSEGRQIFFKSFYDEINSKSIISLSGMIKKYRISNIENLKLKEDIFPIIKEMISKHFFKGDIRTKKGFLVKTKYNFNLKHLLEKVILSDTDLNTERILEEKEKLEDIKNDIYNMTLKLKNITRQITEEIDSYLLIDEIDYAKERLKFIIRDSLMEADFLNENIENSFNEELYYINIKAVLGIEIAQWSKVYSTLQKSLINLDSHLKGKIKDKEMIRDLNILLENLNDRLELIEEDLNRKLDSFKRNFSETFHKEYVENNFNLIIPQLNQISDDINKYDKIIFNISQQITAKEDDIVKKHRDIIDRWLRIKEKYENEYNFYRNGFQFFKDNLKKIIVINEKLRNEISEISNRIRNKIVESNFQEAFEIIKKESDVLLNEKTTEIQNLQSVVKKEIKEKQRLFLLYKHLQDNLENLESTIIDSIATQSQDLKDNVIIERNKTEIKDFDNFVSQEVIKLRNELANVKNKFNLSDNLKVGEVVKAFELIESNFDKSSKLFSKKLSNCIKNIEDFNKKSNLTILQWENFTKFFHNEISDLKDEMINGIISNRINVMAIEKKTNNIKIVDLKDEVKLSCKILIQRLKDMIDISKINAELDEEEKVILVYTNDYYLNKELRNYVENQLLKSSRERVGKILALYDSSIRNSTLSINMLELQNRIKDLSTFQQNFQQKFNDKADQLQMNQERQEFLKTKKYFNSVIENDLTAMHKITDNLNLFNSTLNFIDQQFNSLRTEIKDYYHRFLKKSEEIDSYADMQEDFRTKIQKFREDSRNIQINAENEIKSITSKSEGSSKLIPEIREFFVKKKNEFMEEFNNKIEKIKDQIEIMKNESFRSKLIGFISNSKIKLSQLLGNLERKVEDNIELKEFKRINLIIQKRAKRIEAEIKEIKRAANTKIREYNKQSKNFTQTSKFVLEDFNKFINDYTEILNEKVKSLERLILKSYIDMTIKAVANEYLTISFLNNELKIRKKSIQDHLLHLISSGELKGKFDPRFAIYFENLEILDEIDETELEVIKNTNFKVNMALRHLKNFASQYGSIIAFFASILTISYYLFLFSGGSPAAIIFPVLITILILGFYFLRRKDEKIK